MIEVAIPLDDPSVLYEDFGRQISGSIAIVGEEVSRIDENGWRFILRSDLKCSYITGTPCQPTHRVGRSATGFEAAVDIGTVQDREAEPVVVTEPLFELGVIEVGFKGVFDSGSDIGL